MAQHHSILLVEDNPDDVLFLTRAARHAEISTGFHVASDGQEAIDYLSGAGKFSDKTKYPMPSLVLLDLKLPCKSGLEVLKWIRENQSLKPLPVIMLTTSAENSDVERSYRMGANAYLVKPANMNELTAILKSLKTFWLDHNLMPQISAPKSPTKLLEPAAQFAL